MPPQSTPSAEVRGVVHPILEWLRTPELGWRYEHQQAVTKQYGTNANGVCDEREVLLLPFLRRELKELNPGVITDRDRAKRIIFQLQAEKDNQEWLRWLRNEKTFQSAPEEQYQPIKLVDYDDIENIDFLATNQPRSGFSRHAFSPEIEAGKRGAEGTEDARLHGVSSIHSTLSFFTASVSWSLAENSDSRARSSGVQAESPETTLMLASI